MSRVSATLFALVLAVPAIASAQPEACPRGQVRWEGHCCWPGQTWSDTAARCVGPPACPAGFAAHGDSCVARAPESASAAGSGSGSRAGSGPSIPDAPDSTRSDAYRAALRAEWPTLEDTGVQLLSHSVDVRGEDEVHITGSFALFDLGWVLSWIGILVDELAHNCTDSSFRFSVSCQSWPLGFIPFAGAIAATTANLQGGTRRQSVGGIAIGIPALIFQVAGLIGLFVAFGNETTERGFQPLNGPRSGSVALVPGAAGADAGFSIDVSF
jgi:hypothetical protein